MAKALITLLAAAAFSGAGLLSGDFGGFDPNRFPVPQENPPLQPVGFAFGIWFVIYLWLIASAVFGLAKRSRDPSWQRFRTPLIVSLLVGTPWLEVARVSPVGSTLMIWVMLAFALVALFRAPEKDQAWARRPLGLYAGWLTAASGVAPSISLAGYGVLPQQTAAIVMLLVVLALAVITIVATRGGSVAYGLAVQWALVGVIIENYGISNELIMALTGFGCVLIAAVTWKQFTSSQHYKFRKPI